jgi:hypothetical protein
MRTNFHLICLALSLQIVATPSVWAAPNTFRGVVENVTVGGIETPRRPAIRIGALHFELAGPSRLRERLAGLDGFEAEVSGLVTHRIHIGGEGYDLLTLQTVRLARPTILSTELRRILKEGAPKRLSVLLRTSPEIDDSRRLILVFVNRLRAAGASVEVCPLPARRDRLTLIATPEVIEECAQRPEVIAIELSPPQV